MFVLYGTPGIGKTTWVRQVAKKYLVENGVLKGFYLEVTIGVVNSKRVGVPVHTMRSVIDAVKTRDFMSTLLVDETGAIFARPEYVMGGYTLEQVQPIAEMKLQLSFVTSQSYPTMIVLTTNYKDAIAQSDEALADRIIAWINVPPFLKVREKIMGTSPLRDDAKSPTPRHGAGKNHQVQSPIARHCRGRNNRQDTKQGLQVQIVHSYPTIRYRLPRRAFLSLELEPLDPSIKIDYTYREALRI